jgi:hypothetical protein
MFTIAYRQSEGQTDSQITMNERIGPTERRPIRWKESSPLITDPQT